MSQLKLELPQTPDNEWKDAQFPFDGAWMPDQDPALIGPRNFATLTNLRYKEKSVEGVNGYRKINTTPLATYTTLSQGIQLRADQTEDSFVLVQAVNPASGQGRVYQNTSTPGTQGDFDTTSRLDTTGNPYKVDASVNLSGRFSTAPQSSVVYCNGEESFIYSGFEHRIAAAFLQKDDTPANGVKEVSDEVSTKLQTEYITMPDGTFDELIILTTRPIQGLKFYVKTANAVASTMTVSYWSGSAWVAVGAGSDGTADGGVTLAQTGSYTFTHTTGLVQFKHYEELYLFAYKVVVSAGSAEVYYITVDPAMQTIQNVWDGIYRQPIQFQIYNAATPAYEDYTLQVNQSSDLNAPIGAVCDALTSSDKIYVMFEEQVAAVRMTFLGGLVNSADSTLSMKYWDGDSYAALTISDGTAVGAKTFNQSGVISWTPPADEQRRTLFGSLGYVYEFSFGATLSGTKGGADSPYILVDLAAGLPKLKSVKAFDFSVMFKNRLMLCAHTVGGEGNRMDPSAPNAPDVFNGTEAADNGLNSIYFGGNEKLTGAIQLFNRFGSSIFAMLMVFKETETYMLVGDSPTDYQVYPVSLVVGCPAPDTIVTTEIAPEGSDTLSRNFVLWVSHYGPMMFDGAVIAPIKGIDNYFDPNDSNYVNWDAIHKSRGWIDPNYREWNLLIPTGGATEVNTWLVFDLVRRKWYRKDTATATLPVSGFGLMDPATGEQFSYAGLDTGYMMQLEYGTSWDGVGITQVLKTGDFWPTNNIWDLTLLRKFKLVCARIVSNTSYDLLVYYYKDTEDNPGQSVTFVSSNLFGVAVDFTNTYRDPTNTYDSSVVTDDEAIIFTSAITTAADLTLDVGLARVVEKTIDLNYLGFAHAFSFEVTTNDVAQGFQPIVWGVRYRLERKNDTAN